jgi:indole-3-glycerol phosphate synthase
MSVSKVAKRRGEILDEIMRYHREQLPKIMREVPFADVRALAAVAPPPVDFYRALARPGVSLIAECKKASPSKGLLRADYDPISLAKAYARAGAAAISVLTDERHFQGSLTHLRDIKEMLPQMPVLRKDFLFHPYQLYEARAAGADAVLLIAAVLSTNEMRDLLALSQSLGMEALVEIHTEEELERVLPLSPRILGVNNRNLQTFEVDFANTERLRSRIPAGVLVVGESGIKTEADIRQMVKAGVDAVLVGESLVRSKQVEDAVRRLVVAGKVA